MTEFKVGDKVKHNILGVVEVAYGPYTGTFGRKHSVIRLESGRETSVPADTLTALPAFATFAVGDKVDHRTFGAGTVAFGPFTHHSGPDHYLMVDDDSKHALVVADALTAAKADEPIKVGDKVRVLIDGAEFATVKAGDVFTVSEVRHGRVVVDAPLRVGGRSWYFNLESVEKVTEPSKPFTMRGVTYDLDAKYRDKDGDVWRFAIVDGSLVRGEMGSATIDQHSDLIADVVDNYGPLHKI